jgi:hypothetical protein
LLRPATCAEFAEAMQRVRETCAARGWLPLYHYTTPSVVASIARGGFRMSTQGQGDGGVYFSVKGPTSYDLGSDKYEANIIVDCKTRSPPPQMFPLYFLLSSHPPSLLFAFVPLNFLCIFLPVP